MVPFATAATAYLETHCHKARAIIDVHLSACAHPGSGRTMRERDAHALRATAALLLIWPHSNESEARLFKRLEASAPRLLSTSRERAATLAAVKHIAECNVGLEPMPVLLND